MARASASFTRHLGSAWLTLVLAYAPAGGARATVVISSDPTQGMNCNAGGVCTPSEKNSVLNVTQLENILASSNATIDTGPGTLAGKVNDIDVEAAMTWTNGSTLTLEAYRSVRIDQPISDAGTGALSLRTNLGRNGGTLSFGTKGNVTLFSATNQLTINDLRYSPVFSIGALAAAIAGNPGGHFALGAGYNASVDGTYAHPPIPTTFTGTLEGLGNKLSHLKILDTTPGEPAALFSQIGSGGAVHDLELVTINVSGTGIVGGLVATNSQGSTITGQVVDGSVKAHGSGSSSPNGVFVVVGGVAGENGGTIEYSRSTATITATVSDAKGIGATVLAGGLVGWMDDSLAAIEASWAGGPVTISMNDPAGNANCHAGGLVGENQHGSITLNSFAVGSATISGQCFALSGIGGLVGYNDDGTIDRASASGAATGVAFSDVGGLIGVNFNLTSCTCSVTNSVATGATLGGNNAHVGGFIGENSGLTVANGVASGTVNGGTSSALGGFVGEDDFGNSGDFTNDSWNTQTSNITNCSQGSGNVSFESGIQGTTC